MDAAAVVANCLHFINLNMIILYKEKNKNERATANEKINIELQ